MYKLRLSSPEDATRLIQIWRDAVDATHQFLSSTDRSALDDEVNAYLQKASLWLATDEYDHVLGFLGRTGAHVDALFVDPLHHGDGIGRLLLLRVPPQEAALTVDVNEQNGRAIGFYEKVGFSSTGRSETDDKGRPYPIVNMMLDRSARAPSQ